MTKNIYALVFGAIACTGVSNLGAATPDTDYISLAPFLQRVLTGTTAVTTTAAPFASFVSTTIPVSAGTTVLIGARFSAESRCTESGATVANWCEMRVLIGGQEANPKETASGQDVAFDSTDSGTATGGDYEFHSMDRHICYTNTSGATQQVPVQVEWGVTNLDGGPSPSFWIDDWTLVIQESRNCFDIPVSGS